MDPVRLTFDSKPEPEKSKDTGAAPPKGVQPLFPSVPKKAPASTPIPEKSEPKAVPKEVHALFPSLPKKVYTPASPLIPGIQRQRITVSIEALQQVQLGDSPRLEICTRAAELLKYIRVEMITPALASDLGVEPQAKFAEIANELLDINDSKTLKGFNSKIDELIEKIESTTKWLAGTRLPETLKEIRAIVDGLKQDRPELDKIHESIKQLVAKIKLVIGDLDTQRLILAYLQTPTTPPVPKESIDILADRQEGVTKSWMSARIAISQLELLASNVTTHINLVNSTLFETVPIWCVNMMQSNRSERVSMTQQFLSTLRNFSLKRTSNAEV